MQHSKTVNCAKLVDHVNRHINIHDMDHSQEHQLKFKVIQSIKCLNMNLFFINYLRDKMQNLSSSNTWLVNNLLNQYIQIVQ